VTGTFAEDQRVKNLGVKNLRARKQRVTEQLRQEEYSELPTTKRLIASCRSDVAAARLPLSSNRTLSDAQRNQLWLLVDSREWFIRMVAKDYSAELERIDRELETELMR
jgi:hypothetical protein